MAPRYGLVGGTALRRHDGHDLEVETPWGSAAVTYAEADGRELVFLDRHAVGGRRVPAHRVPHRRNMRVMDRAGAEAVVAVHSVGALDPDLAPGTLAAPEGLVDAAGEPPTVHDDEPVHVAMDPPFCPRVRDALVAGDGIEACGAYVGTRGPRFETPEEVDLLARAGAVVGMTGAGEAAVARELGLCYASLSVVINRAAGLGEDLAVDGIAAQAREAGGAARSAALAALDRLEGGGCPCPDAPETGRLG